MALTRKLLKGMGLSEEQIDTIIGEHVETTDALKGRIQNLENDLKDLPALKAKAEAAGDPENWKGKHDELKQQFDAYRAEVAGKEETARLKTAYKALLSEENVDEKRHDAILRVTDFSKLKFEKDGTLKDAEALKNAIRDEWSAFVVTQGKRGANVATPPANAPAKKTREEIMAIKDTTERQKAMAENHELFGF